MRVDMECTYCGKKWHLDNPTQYDLMSVKCGVCSDKNIKMKDSVKDKVDYYKGSPPFPPPTPKKKKSEYVYYPDDYYGSTD